MQGCRRLHAPFAAALCLNLLLPLAQAQGAAGAVAAPTVSDRGYSYFVGLARQHMRYREFVSSLPIESRASASNAMVVAGALFPLNAQWMVSLDSATTFLPGRSGETWRATADTVNGIALTSRVLQTNRFSLSENATQILGHYRLQGPAFALGGLQLRNQSFKRFAFVSGPDGVAATPGGATVEESISEVMLQAGAALESETVRGQSHHYSVRALLGVPLWRRLTNTQNPALQFKRSAGLDVSLEGRYSWAVTPAIQLGGWGRWVHSGRSREVLGNFEAPKSRYGSVAYGVEALWKL